jgi:hypothetical protein
VEDWLRFIRSETQDAPGAWVSHAGPCLSWMLRKFGGINESVWSRKPSGIISIWDSEEE